MSEPQSSPPAVRLTLTHWLIIVISAIGFAFDTYTILVQPLVLRPVLLEMGQIRPGTPEFNTWAGMLLFVPAVFGGIFGLVGGYLTDWFGRRRILFWSILLYAFSALASGFATSLPVFLALRCTTMIGVCIEFVAAVAWLAELFPHGRQRESILGWTQAFGSFGGMLVTGAYFLIVKGAEGLPAVYGAHDPWRYTMMSGLIPAIPLIIIRPFLPESPAWAEKKEAGTLQRPQFGELFQPAFRQTTWVTMIMMACSFGAAFGAIQHIPRIVPGLPEVVAQSRATLQEGMGSDLAALPKEQRGPVMKQLAEAATKPPKVQAKAIHDIPQLAVLPPEQVDAIVAKLPKITAQVREKTEVSVSSVQAMQEFGGLAGRIVLALLAVIISSRRKLLRIFQVPGLILIPLVFFFPARNNLELFRYGAFLAGFLTVAQFSFWGNYLPLVYPTRLRGTGESFAANIGGRMFGTSAALLTTQLANIMPGDKAPTQLAFAAGTVALLVYLGGFIASFWLPEPKLGDIPD